jgi:hypothetical protein
MLNHQKGTIAMYHAPGALPEPELPSNSAGEA